MATTLFKNGSIIDGTGGSCFAGHVLVEDDRIAAVTRATEEVPEADTTIDVAGSVIAPGFIDILSHSIWTLMKDGRSLSKRHNAADGRCLARPRGAPPRGHCCVPILGKGVPFPADRAWH